MYSWESMPHLRLTAGIGMGPDGQPYKFESEDEYRAWYYSRLNEWLIWA